MNILVTGGTGLIGSQLCNKLVRAGHSVTVLTRDISQIDHDKYRYITSLNEIEGTLHIDAIVNLAGAGIADKAWTNKRKLEIFQSRIQTTEQIVNFIKQQNNPDCVLVSASAIGVYGASNAHDIKLETSEGDNSFASSLCQDWEYQALKAQQSNCRVCILRLGIVLSPDGGALKKMRLPFKLGLGGNMGDGSQWMSWVHIKDVVNAIDYAIANNKISGIYNMVSDKPVTNKVFTKTLSQVVGMPAFFHMPKFVVKLLFGQMGKELLLSGAKVSNEKIKQQGFAFIHTDLHEALKDCL